MSTKDTGQFPLATGANSVRYGERGIGGTVGEYIQNDKMREVTFQLKAGEPLDETTLTKTLPAGYLFLDAYYEVVTGFDGTTPGFQLGIGGGTKSTEDALASALAATLFTVGSMNNLSATTAKDLVVTVDAAGLASTVGEATITCRYIQL